MSWLTRKPGKTETKLRRKTAENRREKIPREKNKLVAFLAPFEHF
jgi:hypothetical protein